MVDQFFTSLGPISYDTHPTCHWRTIADPLCYRQIHAISYVLTFGVRFFLGPRLSLSTLHSLFQPRKSSVEVPSIMIVGRNRPWQRDEGSVGLLLGFSGSGSACYAFPEVKRRMHPAFALQCAVRGSADRPVFWNFSQTKRGSLPSEYGDTELMCGQGH